MKPEVQNAFGFGGASESQIQAFESFIRAPLPEPYRRFLAWRNGGRIRPQSILQISESQWTDPFILYGIAVGPESAFADIARNRQWSEVPDEFLEVGHTGCDDSLALHLETGEVYLWLHPLEREEEDLLGNPIRIACDFGDFLRRLEANAHSDEPHPIFRAVDGWMDVVPAELLLASRNDERNRHGWTLLMMASNASRLDVVKLLLEEGVDLNARELRQATALQLAVSGHSLDAVKMLLDAGADIEACNNEGYTPFLHAIRVQSLAIARFLAEHGANVYARTNEGYDAVQIGAMYVSEGKRPIVTGILEQYS